MNQFAFNLSRSGWAGVSENLVLQISISGEGHSENEDEGEIGA